MILGDDGRIFAAGQNTSPFGSLPITLGMVETTDPGYGGNDVIQTGTGSAIVMGGTGADTISTVLGGSGGSDNTNFVFGDDGYITWVGAELNPENLSWAGANLDPSNIDLVASTTPSDGGNDQITIGAGRAIVVGGAGNDTITGGSGTNVILGDSGRIFAAGANTNPFGTLPITLGMVETTAPGIGGSDTISVGAGSAVVMGGTGADSITTGSSTSFVFGDDGYITWVGSELNPEHLSWAGANSDPTNIDLAASTDYADGGNDQITIGAGQAIVVGGAGDDTITGGSGTNVILGDSGRIFAAGQNTSPFGTLPITLGMVETSAPGIGGDDTIQTGSGSAIVMGGTGADTISTVLGGSGGNDNTNFVFGDDGYITWVGAELNPDGLTWAGANTDPTNIDLVASTTPSDGGNDQITIGSGRAIVVGGAGDDTITGGSGTNVILGDSGRIFAAGEDTNRFGTLPITIGMVETTAPGVGGNDTIQIGSGSAIVMGGTGADNITTSSSTSFVFGDDGYITWVGSELNPENLSWAGANADPTNIDLVASTDYADGGNDTIVVGSGEAIVVGGQGDDTITGGSGTNVILGDSGRIFAASADTNPFGDLPITLGMVETSAPGIGGADTVQVGTGSAIVMGGTGADSITTGSSTSFVFGDDGYITWVGSELNPENLSWAGANADPTNIDLVASTDYADGGNDQITIGSGQAIVVGGQGDDTITGGSGTNVILGDSGRIFAAGANTNPFGTLPITLGMVETTAPGIGGNDTISLGTGSAIVMGGTGADNITTNTSTSFVFGDDGYITWVGSELNPEGLTWAGANSDPTNIDLVASTDTSDGGNDQITIGSGQAIVVGGQGSDTITGGSGTNVILGDSGRIFAAGHNTNPFGTLPITLGMVETTAPGVGGNDTIQTGAGSAIVMGGTGADSITTSSSTSFVFGDDGYITWVGSELNPEGLTWAGANSDPTNIDLVASTDTSDGGNDQITIGSGRSIVVGGQGDDTITGGSGTSVILGDSGRIYSASSDTNRFGDLPITLGMVETTSPGIGGNDTITTLDGSAIVMGGTGADTITTGAGTNIVFGDDGYITWVGAELNPDNLVWAGADANPADIDLVASTSPSDGGNDTITVGAGDAIIVGGFGDDTITGGTASNIIFGDSGEIDAALTDTNRFGGLPITVGVVKSTAPTIGGNDTIFGAAGPDLIVGGIGSDGIAAFEGDNIVIGDNGELDFDTNTGALVTAETTAPTAGGGSDVITSGSGRDVILGGQGDDTILAGGGDNVVFGDDGVATFDPAILVHMTSTDTGEDGPALGGNDTITTGSGNDVIVGGMGNDLINAGEGNNVVFGDSADLTFTLASVLVTATSLAPGFGGNDTITTGAGFDVVVGGFGVDSISAGTGTNVVMGDSAMLTFDPLTGVLLTATSIGTAFGGNDVISTGTGNDVVVGGSGSDTITDAGGSNIVIGDNATIGWTASQGGFTGISATNPTDGGPDTITILGTGTNWVMGGTGGDTITTGDGNDLIFGDFGSLTGNVPVTPFVPSVPVDWAYTSIFTQNASTPIGADDVIYAGNGRNIVIGGQGNDLIVSGNGDDDLIGGHNVPGGQDGSDLIDGGGGNDVIAGDNASILGNGLVTSPLDRTLTAPTIYSAVANPDGSFTYLPNVSTAPAFDPTGVLERTIVLFDGGTTNSTLYGNDVLAGGAGNDLIFGEMGNDVIQGDSSITVNTASLVSAGAATDGNDYIEGGGGTDLIFGDYGQDVLIGGSSDLFGYTTPAQRPDGADLIFGDAGTAIGLNDPGDTSANGHAHNADVILGDNGDVYRLVGADGRFLGFNYDNYAGATEHIVPTAVRLIDYSPYGDTSYTTCDSSDPNTCWTVTTTHPANIGGGDILHGEAGNDVIYGETGADTLFGDGQDDQLYGNSGNDWISGGTGDDGVLGDDGLLEPARNAIAEPLYGLAATTQLTLSTGDGNADDIVVTVNVTGQLNYTAIEQPFFAGGNDIIYGGLGNDFLHGGGGDDAMSGAEALPLYYDNGHNPLGVLASLAQYYTAGNVLGYNSSSQTFRYYNPYDPFEKIMVGPGIDFLLNFVSATSFDATTPQTVVDDGRDVLFGDGGNDWLVGGTNQDVMFGGYGNDVLQADDNLDSTNVSVPVTYDSLCSLVTSYSSSSREAHNLCDQLSNIQYWDAHSRYYDPTNDLDAWVEWVTNDINCVFTADEAATLIRFAQALKPGYDPNANDTVDPRGTGPTNADIAFGGAGHDILIANTAGDRLIDWQDSFNTYVYPWEGSPGRTVIDDQNEDVIQVLYDLSLALGADPTRSETVAPWHGQPDPSFRNGEPFGELGLVVPQDGDWHEQTGPSPWLPWWHDGTNPGLDVEGEPDYGSLGLVVLLTPSAHPQQIESIWHVDDTAEALLNRIVVRGQLTAAEYASLSAPNLEALNDLIYNGLVAKVGGVWMPTNATWLDLGLADPPVITGLGAPSKPTPTTPIVVSGTGDAGDTITVYSDGGYVGASTVAADGTWAVTIFLPVGYQHDITATQTVNQLPEVGLTSGQSCDVEITVYPDPPAITFTSTPGPTTSSTPVTVSGTGDAGDTVTLYDGSHSIGSATTGAAGTWTLTVNLAVGTHSLTATQTTPGGRWSPPQLTSDRSAVASVTVYAPPPAPTVSLPIGSLAALTISGSGVAGDTVTVYEGTNVIGTALVAPNGGWTLSVTLGLGKHTLFARQTSPLSGFTGNASSNASTTIYAQPVPPAITGATTPAQTKTTTPVTVSGTGAAGYAIALYDGGTLIGSTTVGSNGTWSLKVNLGVGVHTLTATQTLVAAVTSDPSGGFSVTVMPPNPVAPTIDSLPSATISSTVTVTGKGVAGDSITLYDSGVVIGTTTIQADGTWSLTVTLGLGSHQLRATQADAVWPLTSVLSSTVSFTIYVQPAPPAITSISTPAPTKTTAQVTVAGTGVAGETITLYDGSTAVGTTTVASNGTWSLKVNLGVGVHTLTATQTLTAGVTSDPSAAAAVTVYPPPPAPPAISSPAPATISSSVTLSGSGAAGDLVTLYDGGLAVGTVTVASNGSWSLAVTLALGAHTLSATQTDPVWGFTSTASSNVVVTVYAQPAPPVIASATVGSVSHGSAYVTVGGTGTAGETITLYDGSTAVGTATVGSNGTWSLTQRLSSGSHTLTATQTLTAGVTSAASAAWVVTVPSH